MANSWRSSLASVVANHPLIQFANDANSIRCDGAPSDWDSDGDSDSGSAGQLVAKRHFELGKGEIQLPMQSSSTNWMELNPAYWANNNNPTTRVHPTLVTSIDAHNWVNSVRPSSSVRRGWNWVVQSLHHRPPPFTPWCRLIDSDVFKWNAHPMMDNGWRRRRGARNLILLRR